MPRNEWVAIVTMSITTALAAGAASFADQSNCCVPNGFPGCDNAQCEATVCGFDPFCCDVAWDLICASEAFGMCEVCQGDPSDCCLANGGLGCGDGACEKAVCAIDPFCCETAWDKICASEAGQLCDICAGDPTCLSGGDCCTANGGLGCNDEKCCNTVCAVDPFCCDVAWDSVCAGEASAMCEICVGQAACESSNEDCCVPHKGVGCGDSECCNAVCIADPFCCDVAWDGICADEANDLCAGCEASPCSPSAGDCCTANGGVGCNDEECCLTVCSLDPFCCQVAWDAICADGAQSMCEACVIDACPDLNGDGGVDGEDLAILLGAWGLPGGSDLDQSGATDAADLAILLGAWGPCT